MALTIPLKIQDETDQVYLERNPKNRYEAMKQTLEKFRDLDPKGVFLILGPEDIREIEGALRNQVRTKEALVRECTRLTTIAIGGIEIPMTDLQMQTLKERATYWNKDDPNGYIKEELIKAVNHACYGVYEVPKV